MSWGKKEIVCSGNTKKDFEFNTLNWEAMKWF